MMIRNPCLFFSAVRPNQERALLSGGGMKAVASRLAEEIMEKLSVLKMDDDEADANIINYMWLERWCAPKWSSTNASHARPFWSIPPPTPKWPSLPLVLMKFAKMSKHLLEPNQSRRPSHADAFCIRHLPEKLVHLH
ncbi:MAG: hypothetical protein GY820_33330 [Gammaproteobacteria bacterium]|nr:hypothetical protein [Gammaproteobacteria bacterium]